MATKIKPMCSTVGYEISVTLNFCNFLPLTIDKALETTIRGESSNFCYKIKIEELAESTCSQKLHDLQYAEDPLPS